MLLLSGHSLAPKRKIPLEAMSLQLKERDSTATMAPADMTGIGIGSWVKDETEPGAGIVWRVSSIGQAFAARTVTVQLEHAAAILKDRILFGEHKAPQITGNKNAKTCTAEQAVRYILGKQGDWTLGDFDYKNVSNAYQFDGDTLFDALETVSDSLEDCFWSYDFTVYPFKLHIKRMGTDVGSELRAGRNIKTITKTVDRGGMYTRFYPIGANDLHIDGDYVEKNADLYGVVSKVETDQSITDKAELVRWANERLKKHAEPSVSIDVDGYELAAATGEKMDRLKLGEICRVPLPEFGTTITEKIVTLSYADKVHQPEVVKVTLANSKNDVTKIIADALKSGGRGGRAAAKRDKEDLAWFEDTNDHVAMCAKGIVGVDAKGDPNWIRLSKIYVDGNGIAQSVESVQNDLTIAETKITQNEDAITLEATKRIDADSGLKSSIKTQADRISLVVEGTGNNAHIRPAQIVASINEAGSSVLISASHVRLDGNTTVAGMLGVENGGLKVKGSAFIQDGLTLGVGKTLTATYYAVSSAGSISFGGSTPGSSYSLTGTDVKNMLVGAEVEGNVLKITDHSGNEVTFSKATSLSDGWSGNTYTVTAKQNGETVGTKSVSPYVQPVSGQGSHVDLYVATGASGSPGYDTHGTAKKLYLVKDGTYIRLNSTDSTSGSTYAQVQIAGLGIYDTDSQIVTSRSITSAIDLWAGYNVGGSEQYGSKVTITPTIAAANVTLGSYTNTSGQPSGTDASSMWTTIKAAYNNGNWFSFTIKYNNTNIKTYRFKCT